MKHEETTAHAEKKIMKNPGTAYLWAQAAAAALLVLVPVFYGVLCAVRHSGDVYVILFALWALASHRFLYRPAVAELRAARGKGVRS